MFMCTYALHTVFMHAFWFRLINIHVLLDFRFTVVPLISFMLLVIACTCMPEPHYLIMYTYDCLYACHLDLSYVLTGCIWQPWILMSRSRSMDCVDLTIADQRAQQRGGLADATVALSSQLLSWLVLETPLDARDHLSAFDYVYPFVYRTFVFSGDVISCNIVICITLCDNHVLVLFCWNVYYHCTSALWFLHVLILSVYT